MADLYQGAIAPEFYAMDLVPGDSGIDLSTVTAVTFQVYRPDGTVVSWTPTVLTNVTANTLTATYAFDAVTSPIANAGDHLVHAVLTIPSGTVTSERVRRQVRARHEVIRN